MRWVLSVSLRFLNSYEMLLVWFSSNAATGILGCSSRYLRIFMSIQDVGSMLISSMESPCRVEITVSNLRTSSKQGTGFSQANK